MKILLKDKFRIHRISTNLFEKKSFSLLIFVVILLIASYFFINKNTPNIIETRGNVLSTINEAKEEEIQTITVTGIVSSVQKPTPTVIEVVTDDANKQDEKNKKLSEQEESVEEYEPIEDYQEGNEEKIKQISLLFDNIGDLNIRLFTEDLDESEEKEIKQEISSLDSQIQQIVNTCTGDECQRFYEEVSSGLEANGLIVR